MPRRSVCRSNRFHKVQQAGCRGKIRFEEEMKTSTELLSRAEALYESRIRPNVEAGNRGKCIAIDVNSGDYEVGQDYLGLTDAVSSRHAEELLATLRIGYQAVGRI